MAGWKETIVGRLLFGFFPDTFDGVEIWRIGREPVKLNTPAVGLEPSFALFIKIVAGPIVEKWGIFSSGYDELAFAETAEKRLPRTLWP